jgi:[ribosomal protein S18]-alanine N-acetyltransferase
MIEKFLPIRIRIMNFADLNKVMAIEPTAYGQNHWSKKSFENELKLQCSSYYCAFAMETSELLGYSGFWLIGEEVHITTLAVHSDFQRRYVGERLLINDILEAKRLGAHWITLEVRATNERALNLYFKYGFKSMGRLKKYYKDNDEDALVLWTENIESPLFNKVLAERIALVDPQSENQLLNIQTELTNH